jgi:predicted phage terminase large subunit-like protein
VQHIDAGAVSFVNFEVAGDNTFFADGVLTHNCSEQAILAGDPDKAFATAWDYVQVGPLQRLMPGGKIIMIGTRWSKRDPIGRALAWAENNPDSTPWHEVRFPAIMPSGKSLWPEQWPVEQLMAKKAGMAPQYWAAQYLQEPTSEEGALIKREWWKRWPHAKPPKCDIILQSWDTAHGKNDSADPSGVHTWGVWFNEEANQDHLILLDAWTGRKEFPELKKFAFEYYKEWEPDMVVIEKKAAGAPLIQEMRATGLPIHEFTPSRGADKRVRINAVADMFSSGMVWAPETRWAQEVIDQIAEFPNSEHDEHVDCCSQALMRVRQGGLIRLASDEPDEPQLFRRARAAYY